MIRVTATKVIDAIEDLGAVEIHRVYTEYDGLECHPTQYFNQRPVSYTQ